MNAKTKNSIQRKGISAQQSESKGSVRLSCNQSPFMEEEGKLSLFGSTAAAAAQPETSPAERIASAVAEISGISDYRNAYRKQLNGLSRQIKLLAPLTDELLDRTGPISGSETLEPLSSALDVARDFLRFGSEGSKIFMVLEKDSFLKRFQKVISQLDQALCAISFDELELSDEVREQVELVHAQIKRAKDRIESQDDQLYNELISVYTNLYKSNTNPKILESLSEKLFLITISDLKQESLALHEMVVTTGGGDPGEHIEKMSMLLKKIKDFVQTRNPEMGTLANPKGLIPEQKPLSPNIPIPDDFRCPILLELMTDPVIVSTGQTYERSCIEKWLASGHDTCPSTQQKLHNKTLTTNYVLRSLISQWCESNGIDVPKRRPANPIPGDNPAACTDLDAILDRLRSSDPAGRRSAAGELRLLAKRNAGNRLAIAHAGAIPLLKELLHSPDLRTQEHAVTALLNLSIHDDNKAGIVNSNCVPGVVYVLRSGSMEARENAAATLFSLSVIDEYKVSIGMTGAIPALVALLSDGTQRGKKDAATALFNLCIYQGNKGKAVRAGIVPLILGLVSEQGGGMMDEAMAILAILASHPEGRAAIGAAEAVPMLVEMVGVGASARNRENAAAVLLHLCSGGEEAATRHLATAEECGAMGALRELAINGTDRGKRKAVQLLERLSRFVVQREEESGSGLDLISGSGSGSVSDLVSGSGRVGEEGEQVRDLAVADS